MQGGGAGVDGHHSAHPGGAAGARGGLPPEREPAGRRRAGRPRAVAAAAPEVGGPRAPPQWGGLTACLRSMHDYVMGAHLLAASELQLIRRIWVGLLTDDIDWMTLIDLNDELHLIALGAACPGSCERKGVS